MHVQAPQVTCFCKHFLSPKEKIAFGENPGKMALQDVEKGELQPRKSKIFSDMLGCRNQGEIDRLTPDCWANKRYNHIQTKRFHETGASLKKLL